METRERIVVLLEGLAERVGRLERLREKQFSAEVIDWMDGINRDGGGGARNPFAAVVATAQRNGLRLYNRTNTRRELDAQSVEAIAESPDGQEAIELIRTKYRDASPYQPLGAVRSVVDQYGVTPAQAAEAGRVVEMLAEVRPGVNNGYVTLQLADIGGRDVGAVQKMKARVREISGRGSAPMKPGQLEAALRQPESVGAIAQFLAASPYGAERNWAAAVLGLAINNAGSLSRALADAGQALGRRAVRIAASIQPRQQ